MPGSMKKSLPPLAKKTAQVGKKEERALAILLVLGLVVWISHSLANYYAAQEANYRDPFLDYFFSRHMIIPLVGIVCFLGYGLYVTRIVAQVRRAEKALRQSEERYRQMARLLPQVVYEIDSHGAIVFMNEAGLKAFGFPASQLDEGVDFMSIFAPSERLHAQASLTRALKGEKLNGEEYTAQRSDGSSFPITLYSAPLMRDDSVVGLRGFAVDTTDQKKALQEKELLIADLIETKELLLHQATHDPLTGLLNRAALLDALHKELERANRESTSLSVVMVDIDHFKQINDSYGHLVGDEVLRQVAYRLRKFIRTYDSCGRYGGEEFILVLPGCDLRSGHLLAERLRSVFDSDPLRTMINFYPVTLSFGVASATGPNTPDVDSLIRKADQALYRAKCGGRNRVESTSAPTSEP